jgi:adenine phosphoribosyltransferase
MRSELMSERLLNRAHDGDELAFRELTDPSVPASNSKLQNRGTRQPSCASERDSSLRPTMSAETESERLAAEIKIVGGHADVWRLFDDADRLREIAAALVEPFRQKATKVAGIETRGFILGTAAALELGVGFVPVRKTEGLFPGAKEICETEPDYRGNRHQLRLQRAALMPQDRVLLVDDWIETGSQARAAGSLIERCGARLIGVATVVTQVEVGDVAHLGLLHALVREDRLGWDHP